MQRSFIASSLKGMVHSHQAAVHVMHVGNVSSKGDYI
jgi:hypothetical protein